MLSNGGDRRGQQRGHGGEPDRRLSDEDRPPVEGLGERASQRRPRGGARHGGAHPEPAPGAAAVQSVEGSGQQSGRADRLKRAHHEQQLERAGAGAADRGGGEQQGSGRAGAPAV
jgi:hypothetical protein